MPSVLTVNAGSSSLKLRFLGEHDELVADEELEARHGRAEEAALTSALERMPAPDAVGHRIVHGGAHFRGPVSLDARVVEALRALTPLAPLHQPAALDALAAVSARLPDVPAIACFDTAFHATLPPAAATYAVPAEWRERHGVRRFGFHGLSHAYAARRAGEILERERLRVVTCHLGAGASLAAVHNGGSVDTTMGFTPVEGLVMATRSGSVDPGMLLWLLERVGLEPADVSDALEHRSGLRALAGTADMRQVLTRADAGDEDAALARDVYVHRLRAAVAAMAAAMGGLDALVFTGGVGENAAEIRRRAADGLGFLGVAIGADKQPDADVSMQGAAVHTLVIRAREDLEMAHQVRGVLAASPS